MTFEPLSETNPSGSGTTFVWTRIAAIMMHMLWRRKEVASVPRALGPINRVDAKMKQPRRKDDMEVRDLSQANGFDLG